MDLQNEKSIMSLTYGTSHRVTLRMHGNENLPPGIIANMTAIMRNTLGKEMPGVVGTNVTDQSGNEYLGIIEFPIPILKVSPEIIKAIHESSINPTTAFDHG